MIALNRCRRKLRAGRAPSPSLPTRLTRWPSSPARERRRAIVSRYGAGALRRALSHARFLYATFARLTKARHGLAPRLPGRADRVRTLAVVLALWLQAAARRRVPIPALRLVVAGKSTTIRVSDESEFFGSYEVLSTGDYDIDCGDVRRVLDLGANVGFASMLFAERYSGAEIVAVEAAPDTYARLQANVADLASVRVLHLAVGIDGPVLIDLGVPSAERQASSSGVLVPGKSLTRLLDDLGWDHVDLMKIDIEGAEATVFADPALRRVCAIVGEIHGKDDPQVLLPGYDVEANPAVGSSATMVRAVRATS